MSDLPVVYGGPFSDETDAITREINIAKQMKRKPNFDAVVKDWETISQGALDFIKVEGQPDETQPVGVVYQNVLFETDPEPVYEVPKVMGDIEMPPPLAGFIPVETFVAPEEDIFEEEKVPTPTEVFGEGTTTE